jgi:hypothetical protein
MNLEELRKEWNAVKSVPRSHDEWRSMMYAPRSRRFRSVTKMETLGFCGKLLFVITLTIAFDLFNTWATAILTLWSLLILVDDYTGIRYMFLMPHYGSLRKTLEEGLRRIKWFTFVTRLLHVLVLTVGSLIICLVAWRSGITETLVAALVSLVIMFATGMWWSSKRWADKIAEVTEMLQMTEKETSSVL